ncbi:MAG: aspartate kinase [Thermaerobacter sp.]
MAGPGSEQPIIVQKFGGTSVDGPQRIRNVVKHILAARQRGYRVVVVVSAPGDMTDDLLAQARELNPDPNRRELDVLLSTGEQISIALVAMALEAAGQPALSLTGLQAGIYTDGAHGKARILRVDPERVLEGLDEGRVVVVAGFQGVDPEQDITTLGRGGSDLTAVALAAALNAEACEIFTDVDGVYTADPRIVPNARRLDAITHAEMLELASLGAQVMQARSIEYAMRLGVDLRVRSSLVDGPGTWIRRDAYVDHIPVVTGVTCDRKTAKITVIDMPDRPGAAWELFSAVADRQVNVDLIIQSASRNGTVDLTFTVPEDEFAAAREAAEAAARSLGASGISTDTNIAKVSVVGAGMMNTPGVAARIFGALGQAGINIDLIGCSEIKVSCVVAREKAEAAVRVLHDAFNLGEEAAG